MDGLGTSGVCTQEFSFTISTEEYNLRTIPPNAEAKLYTDVAGEYLIACGFISVRSKKGGTVSFTTYDRMAYTDQTIIFSESDFTDNTISSTSVMSKVQHQCGFESWGLSSADIDTPIPAIPREKVEGRTGREILEMLSKAWCGVFHTPDNEKLLFLPFEAPLSAVIDYTEISHTQIVEGNVKGPIEQVIITNGSEEFQAGNIGADVFKTLKISSDLASGELAAKLMQRVNGLIYQAWDCSKLTFNDIVFDSLMTFKTQMDINGVTRITNHVEKSITAYGIFSTCGVNEFSENEFEYLGAISRKIANKISDGEELGNKQLVTRYQGIIHLAGKENSSGRAAAEPPKRYGYSPATYEGVVKFDGAMVDKALPEVTVKNDLSGFSTTYGDTVIDYDLVWDGDNVTLKEKEAVQ